MTNAQRTVAAKPVRVSVVADAGLAADLRAHQRRVREQTGMRVSLSQVAASLLRRGLGQEATPST